MSVRPDDGLCASCGNQFPDGRNGRHERTPSAGAEQILAGRRRTGQRYGDRTGLDAVTAYRIGGQVYAPGDAGIIRPESMTQPVTFDPGDEPEPPSGNDWANARREDGSLVVPGDDRDDPVNHPSHYTSHPSGTECIEIVRHMGYNLGTVIACIWRAGYKGSLLEDLRKARWHLDDEIARVEKQEQVLAEFTRDAEELLRARERAAAAERDQVAAQGHGWCNGCGKHVWRSVTARDAYLDTDGLPGCDAGGPHASHGIAPDAFPAAGS